MIKSKKVVTLLDKCVVFVFMCMCMHVYVSIHECVCVHWQCGGLFLPLPLLEGHVTLRGSGQAGQDMSVCVHVRMCVRAHVCVSVCACMCKCVIHGI